MAVSTLSVPTLSFLIFMIISINSGGIMKLVNGQEKTWCVAKPSSSDAELIANIHFACDSVSDCKVIQPGGACYLPITNLNHASVAMNLYYQKYGRHSWNCDFTNSGLIVTTDPSYADCTYYA